MTSLPISDTEFNRARRIDPTDAAIRQFLARNRDKAFGPNEVADALGLQKGGNLWEDFSALVAVHTRLDQMAERGETLRKRVLGRWYYKAPR